MKRLIVTMLWAGIAASKSIPELQQIEVGTWVKIEARSVPGGKFTAHKLQPVSKESSFEVEGKVTQIDGKTSSFRIGPFTITTSSSTKFEAPGQQPLTFSSISKGTRVKVKARDHERLSIKARTVRVYGSSSDNDLEITAPVEMVDKERGNLTLLSQLIKVSTRTRYAAVDGVDTKAPGLRRDDDEQSIDPIRLGRAYIGGRVSFESELNQNLDLDDKRRDPSNWAAPSTELLITMPVGESSEAFVRLNSFNRIMTGPDPRGRMQTDLSVREAFVYIGNFLHPSMALQIGRQRFRDKREWLYDDQLDAVRLHIGGSKFRVELSAAKGLVGPTSSRSDQFHYIANAQYQFKGRRYLSAYVLKRNDVTARDEDPLWFGLSARGPVFEGLDYWTELAAMRGRRQNILMRGVGADAGLSYRFKQAWQPTFAAAYAFGSGDRDLNDGVDGNFRQTSLNDNTSRYNGLKRYRYYGILTEPELSNLKIINVDAGVRPSDSWSLNFSYHSYRQVEASRRLGGFNITARPNGRDPRLGKEFDIVLAIRRIPRTDLNFYTGMFLPGPAFSSRAARSFFFRNEVRVYF